MGDQQSSFRLYLWDPFLFLAGNFKKHCRDDELEVLSIDPDCGNDDAVQVGFVEEDDLDCLATLT